MSEKEVYAIYDKVAEEIIGGLLAFTHDAPVIRIFLDGLADPSTMLHKHPDDYELLSLGCITGLEVVPHSNGPRTVLTGSAWKATRELEEASK